MKQDGQYRVLLLKSPDFQLYYTCSVFFILYFITVACVTATRTVLLSVAIKC